jgi:ribonuclease PH
MRSDGRQPDQMRPVVVTPHYLQTAEGSVLIEFGYTRVLCAATVEDSVPPFKKNSGEGWVTAEYSMLPRSTVARTPREVTKGKASGRTLEIQRLIGRSLRAIVDMKKLGERSIIVDCDVLQADGGTRTASITGAMIALGIAVNKLEAARLVPPGVLTDTLAAISVGIVNGVPMLDLCYTEDSRADVDMNVVLTGAGRYVELQSTAEHAAFDDDQLQAMISLARKGIAELTEIQKGYFTL